MVPPHRIGRQNQGTSSLSSVMLPGVISQHPPPPFGLGPVPQGTGNTHPFCEVSQEPAPIPTDNGYIINITLQNWVNLGVGGGFNKTNLSRPLGQRSVWSKI